VYGLKPTSKRKHCMITNTNMAMLTTCDFWQENTTRKHYQRCSACRGLFNKVQYIVSIIYSIHIRKNIVTWWKKQRMLLSTSTITTAAQCVGQTVNLVLFNNPMHF